MMKRLKCSSPALCAFPLVILLRVKCLSMSPRPDLIPGGTARATAVSCSCLSWWPHVPVPLGRGGMLGMPRLFFLHNLAVCFPWKKEILYTLQQRLNR